MKHPHIVRVLDAGRSEGTPYVVTAYIRGESLTQRLGDTNAFQSPTQVYGWLLDIAEALDFIHAKKATHGEVETQSHPLRERRSGAADGLRSGRRSQGPRTKSLRRSYAAAPGADRA